MFRTALKKEEIERALASVDRFSNNWVQRSAQRETVDPVREIGTQLFSALFEGGIGEIYRTASNQALSAGTGLRLRLIMRDAAIARLPWEFLYDPLRRDFVALSVQTSIVRQWQEPLPRPFRSTEGSPNDRVRILMVEGRLEQPMPGIAKEIAALRDMAESNFVELKVIEDASWAQFRLALEKGEYEVVIFSGSASVAPLRDIPDAQALFFRRPKTRDWDGIGRDELVEAISRQSGLRLVYLSACNTDWLAGELAKVVPAAIGMRGNVADNACVAFTTRLLRAALDGLWLDAAVAHGRRAIDLDEPGNRGWGIPVFYLGVPGGLRLREPLLSQEVASGNPQVVETEDAVIIGGVRLPRRKAAARNQRRVDELQTLLAVHQQNLDDLQKQIANFAGSAAPEFLRVQLQEEESKVGDLQNQIEALP